MRRCRRLAPLVVALVALARTPVGADGIMLVQAGAVWIGRDDGAPDERPRHRVFVRDVWIERQKVTRAEFAGFVAARGSRGAHGEPRWDAAVADGGVAGAPATGVTWYGARDFCAARGRRLPTEVEWEKAATGAFGVEDLLAPPAEWTSTRLAAYPYHADDGREPWDGRGRVVVRGGDAARRRALDRRGAAAGHPDVGFRCATSEDLGEIATGRQP